MPPMADTVRFDQPASPVDAGLLRDACALLRRAVEEHSPAALGTAFNIEGSVLIHLCHELGLQPEVFTLDTGRLPPETHEFAERLEKRYGLTIRFYLPSTAAVEALIARQGTNGFRGGVDQRKACCAVRKVDPLERVLAGKHSWITGLRRGQSDERASTKPVDWNPYHGVWKYAPLADWSAASVWAFVREQQIPYHPLYERGYASIGCASCTRAITPGEDERAGRWWWEAPDAGKECGLHTPVAERPVEWQI